MWTHNDTRSAPSHPISTRRELHEQCRSSLEQGYLHSLLLHAQGSAREAAPAAASGADGGVCVAAVRLLGAILSWPFSSGGGGAQRRCRLSTMQCNLRCRLHVQMCNHGAARVLRHGCPLPLPDSMHRHTQRPPSAASGSEAWRVLDSGRPAFEATSLRPPAAWAEAFLSQDAWAWLAPLAQARGCGCLISQWDWAGCWWC